MGERGDGKVVACAGCVAKDVPCLATIDWLGDRAVLSRGIVGLALLFKTSSCLGLS